MKKEYLPPVFDESEIGNEELLGAQSSRPVTNEEAKGGTWGDAKGSAVTWGDE